MALRYAECQRPRTKAPLAGLHSATANKRINQTPTGTNKFEPAYAGYPRALANEMNRADIKERSEGYRLGLLTGACTTKEVISWADEIIASDESPDIEIIEISCSNKDDKNELISKLACVKGESNQRKSIERLFRFFARQLDQNNEKAHQIARNLYTILREHEEHLNDDEEASIYTIDDAFDLALEGTYGTIEEATKELSEFLHSY